MKTPFLSVIAIGISVICITCGRNQSPGNKQEAQARIEKLMNVYFTHTESQDFQTCLTDLDEILGLCEKFSLEQALIMDITDRKIFTLMNLGQFYQALELAFKLEEMSVQSEDRDSPWYYLKIADCYHGMKNKEKAVEWIGKAVNEKGFKNYKIFQGAKYQQLQTDSTFQSLVSVMKRRIGLDQPARDFAASITNGSTFNLSSQKGKVVLIDFWDVRCAPCIKALPELKNLYSDYHEEGLEIIGISLDTDHELLSSFLKKNALPWPIACSYKGWKDETAALYGISATPSTWLVDRQGILRYNEIRGDELKEAIEILLKGSNQYTNSSE
ncbi:MAG: TlpA disulfide reductase family protein [Bacteroidota bacterium]